MNNLQYTKYLFDNVKKISFADPGVIRDTYGRGENLTHKFLIKELKKFTKNIIIDFGGNFLATYEGKSKKKIIIGSHLDSQKHGGNFDGLAGVIMGIIVIKFFYEKKNYTKKFYCSNGHKRGGKLLVSIQLYWK